MWGCFFPSSSSSASRVRYLGQCLGVIVGWVVFVLYIKKKTPFSFTAQNLGVSKHARVERVHLGFCRNIWLIFRPTSFRCAGVYYPLKYCFDRLPRSEVKKSFSSQNGRPKSNEIPPLIQTAPILAIHCARSVYYPAKRVVFIRELSQDLSQMVNSSLVNIVGPTDMAAAAMLDADWPSADHVLRRWG